MKINVTIVSPQDSETIENLDQSKYLAAVARTIRTQYPDHRFTFYITDDDGTTERTIDMEHENDELQAELDEALMAAESDAWCDPDNYREVNA